jgi:hypothetical protein
MPRLTYWACPSSCTASPIFTSKTYTTPTTMPPLRPLRTLLAPRHVRLYATQHKTPHTVTDNPVPANNPSQNVTEAPRSSSSSNTMPITSVGAEDRALQETPEEGEQKRLMQAPNRAGIWSRSQQPRGTAMSGPRFEQTIMEDQVYLPLSIHKGQH